MRPNIDRSALVSLWCAFSVFAKPLIPPVLCNVPVKQLNVAWANWESEVVVMFHVIVQR